MTQEEESTLAYACVCLKNNLAEGIDIDDLPLAIIKGMLIFGMGVKFGKEAKGECIFDSRRIAGIVGFASQAKREELVSLIEAARVVDEHGNIIDE